MIFTYNMLSTTYPPSMNKKEKSRKFMIRLWKIGGKVGQLCLIVCENLWIISPFTLASVIHNLFHRLSTSLSTNLYFTKSPLHLSLFLSRLTAIEDRFTDNKNPLADCIFHLCNLKRRLNGYKNRLIFVFCTGAIVGWRWDCWQFTCNFMVERDFAT